MACLGGQQGGQLDLAGLEHAGPHRRLVAEDDLDLGDGRLVRSPVVLVGLEQEVVALDVLDQLVRPAADRLGDRGVVGHAWRATSAPGSASAPADSGRWHRRPGRDVDGVVVDLGGFGPAEAELVNAEARFGRVGHVGDHGHHRVGVDRLAVDELEALAELEAPGLRVGLALAEALGQLADDLRRAAGPIAGGQLVVDVAHHEVGVVGAWRPSDWIVSGVRLDHDRDRALRLDLGRGPRRRGWSPRCCRGQSSGLAGRRGRSVVPVRPAGWRRCAETHDADSNRAQS